MNSWVSKKDYRRFIDLLRNGKDLKKDYDVINFYDLCSSGDWRLMDDLLDLFKNVNNLKITTLYSMQLTYSYDLVYDCTVPYNNLKLFDPKWEDIPCLLLL